MFLFIKLEVVVFAVLLYTQIISDNINRTAKIFLRQYDIDKQTSFDYFNTINISETSMGRFQTALLQKLLIFV